MARRGTAGARDLAILLALAVAAVVFWKLRIIDPPRQQDLQKSLTNVDFFTYTLPVELGISRRLRQGEIPLWNPYQATGHPVLATIPAGVLYPFNLPYLLLPAHVAIEAVVMLHLIAAGAFMFLYARGISLGRTAAAGAAIAFMFSGYVSSRAVWFVPALAACVWLPLALLAVERILERGRAAWSIALGIAIAMPILAGWLQLWTYSMYAIALYAGVGYARCLWRGGRPENLRIAALLAGGAALGLALAAVQLLPSFELQTLSPRRTGSLSGHQTMFFGGTPPRQLVAQATHPGAGQPRWEYLGMPALVLLPLTLLSRGRRLRVPALWCIAGLGLVLALTVYTPIYAAFQRLPTGNWFRTPQRILYLYAFGGSALIGVALQELSSLGAARGRRWAALALAAGVAAILCWKLEVTARGAAYLWLTVAAIACAILSPSRRLRTAAPIALVGLLAWDLFFATRNAYAHPYHEPEIRNREQELFAYLRAHQRWDRTYVRATGKFSFDVMAKHGTLEQIYSITDYEPLSLKRRADFFRLLDRREEQIFDQRPFNGWLDADPESPAFDLLDLMSVRYAVVHVGDKKFRAALARRRDKWRGVYRRDGGDYLVYENRTPLPRAYVAYDVQRATSAEGALAAIASPGFDPRQTVVIEGAGGGASGDARARIAPARILHYEAERVVVEANATRAGYLVLTDTHYPGWRARIDGQSQPIEAANYLFRGVRLAPGRHRVEFTYAPASVRLGASATLAALAVLGVWGSRGLIRRRRRRGGALPGGALLLLALLVCAGCGAPATPPNLVVFVLDTQRRDHLGAYGYERRDVSPVIDRLAEEGVVFDRVAAVAPRTWQSFTSILTGLYPPRHGVRFIFSPPLSRDVPTLASELARHGYRTAAFDGMTFLRAMTGESAFQEYVDPGSLPGSNPMLGDAAVMDAFLAWLEGAEPPFLAFLRLTAPHWTYVCDPVFHGEVADHGAIAHRFNAGSHGLGLRDGELGLTDMAAYRQRFYEYDPPPAEREHMILHYDECVHASDAQVGRGIERLRGRGLLDSTLVVVTADHGESFGEHGYLQHGPRVDGPVIDVPLILRFPDGLAEGRRGVRVAQLVRGVDVFPTIFSALGLPPPPGLDGVDLLPAIDRGADLGLTAYAEGGRAFVGVDPGIHLPGVAGKRRMLREGDWKLVYVPDGAQGIVHLYDLAGDPGETRDVASEHPEVVARLRGALEALMRDDPGRSQGEPELSDEEKERLRALGYL